MLPFSGKNSFLVKINQLLQIEGKTNATAMVIHTSQSCGQDIAGNLSCVLSKFLPQYIRYFA